MEDRIDALWKRANLPDPIDLMGMIFMVRAYDPGDKTRGLVIHVETITHYRMTVTEFPNQEYDVHIHLFSQNLHIHLYEIKKSNSWEQEYQIFERDGSKKIIGAYKFSR